MSGRFEGKQVIIIGASGGLGGAFARAFAKEGAALILAARSPSSLTALAQEIGGKLAPADLTDSRSLEMLHQQAGRVDVVVNATGFSPRKSLAAHTDEEISRTLHTNLMGAILITRTFAPSMAQSGGGVIVHLGGYADGRLALPFFSVDAASRAGIMTFSEAINREYRGTGVRVLYFSPSPAETETERPYHPVWRKLGQPVVSAEKVATALLDSVSHKRQIHIMGGALPRVFSRLNAIFPRLAEMVMINRYKRILESYFGDGAVDTVGDKG
ncbi:MAG: SDR family NAD(P)-dependent oxidoreductase [Anaerolineae bacterium]|nr:SDR family NAD(P)-dependent oxidoreductase [Anaerolineae bacterium]